MTNWPDFAPRGRITIVGIGLLGGSLAAALRAAVAELEISAVDRSEVIDAGRSAGLIARGARIDALDAALVEFDPDVVVLASPLDAIIEALPRVARYARGRDEAPLVFDLGSVKSTVLDAARACRCPRFVGGHPMAGSERTGIGHADGELFRDAPFVISGAPSARDAALVASLATSIGARPLEMDASSHDHFVALTSHLPHLLAYDLMGLGHTDAGVDINRAPWSLVGGSWRDLTRVAAASPELWEQIFRHNRAALLERLDQQISSLRARREALAADVPVLSNERVSGATLSSLCQRLRASDADDPS
jgi:prephenate dehydrogenase